MSIRRFIINSGNVSDGHAVVDGEVYKHIARVLRMGAGDPLLLVDEHGVTYCGNIELVTKKNVEIAISSIQAADGGDGASPRITICQALPKGDRIDLILQKCTELGAHDFQLFGG
ncbi:MAG: RsmE family RNA methyltransferase, partial [Pseudomonadota bacterium]